MIKRRLIMIMILTFAISLFGFTTSHVSAAESIPEIDITNVTEPVAGQLPNAWDFIVSPYEYIYISSAEFQNINCTGEIPYVPFVAGTQCVLKINIFSSGKDITEDTVVKYKGEVIPDGTFSAPVTSSFVVKGNDGAVTTATIYLVFTAKTPLDEVDITNVTEPVGGQTPVVGGIAVSTGASIHETPVFLENTDEKNIASTFVGDERYVLNMKLDIDEQYVVTSATKFKYNGSDISFEASAPSYPLEYDSVYLQDGVYNVALVFTASKTPINEVNITNVIEPVHGGTPMLDGIQVSSNVQITMKACLINDLSGDEQVATSFVGGQSYIIGLVIVPNEGYMFDSSTKFKYNGNELNVLTSLPSTALADKCCRLDSEERTTIFLVFTVSEPTHKVTIAPSENGTIIGTSLTEVIDKEARTLTIKPDANYMLDRILVNGVDKTDYVINDVLTISNITEDITVKAYFKKIPCLLTINNVEGATITPNGSIDVENGTDFDIIITANRGYTLKSVKVNGVEHIDGLLDGNKLTLTKITEDTEVIVVVEPTKYVFLKGANQKVSDLSEVLFRIDADYSKFSTGGRVFVDNVELDSTQYTSKSGSTIISLLESFLKTLTKGLHTLKIIFNDGVEVTTTFTIATSSGGANPQTGDNIVVYVIVAVVSLLGIGALVIANKKGKIEK